MCLKAPCVKAFPAQKKFTFPACFSEKPSRIGKKKNAGKREKKKPLETQADQGLCPDPAVPCFHIGRKKKSPGRIPADRIGNAGKHARQDGRQDGTPGTTAGTTDARQAPTAGRHASRAVPQRPDQRQNGPKKPRNDGPAHALRAHARLMEGTQKAVPGSKATRHGRTQGRKATRQARPPGSSPAGLCLFGFHKAGSRLCPGRDGTPDGCPVPRISDGRNASPAGMPCASAGRQEKPRRKSEKIAVYGRNAGSPCP